MTIRRLTIICVLCLVATLALAQRITRRYDNVSMSKALMELNDLQGEYVVNFIYDELEDFKVTTDIKHKKLTDAILQIVGFYPIRVVKSGEHEIFVECTHKTDRHLTGTIIDEQGQPVAYANIAILNPTDSTLLSGGVSNESGYFAIPYEQEKVLARISYVGYKTVWRLCDWSQMGTIRLQPDNYTLKGVTVKGYKPTMKIVSGGIVIDVQNTVLAQLGDANDVLAQLPLVSGNNGNFNILGKKKTVIYINNRLMQDPKELSEIQSSSIKDIKIDLTPGARYSADVDAVIKITTIRPVGEGFGGEIVSRYDRKSFNEFYDAIRLNYRHQDLDIFFNGTYYNHHVDADQTSSHHFIFNGTPIHAETEDKIGDDNYQDISLTGGFNFNISSKQLIGLRYNFIKAFPRVVYMKSKGSYSEGDTVSEYESISNKDNRNRGNHNVNAFYQNDISDRWQLNVDATYINHEKSVYGHQQEWKDRIPSEMKNQSEQRNRLWAVKAWNTNQLFGGMLEWGVEATNTKSEQVYLMLSEEVAQRIPSTETISKQNAQSVFVDYARQFGSLTTSLGLRYEHVDFDNEINHKHNDDASRNYNNLFPSLAVSYSHERFNLTLGYRTIVQRPSYYELRGEVEYNNSYSVEKGNPELQPCYNHSISLMAEHRNLVFDASYDILKDACVFYNQVMSEYPMTLANYMNHDMQTYHVNLVYSPTIGVWKPSWQIGTEGQVLHDDGKNYSGASLNYEWKNIWSLPRKWTITFNIFGSSAQYMKFINIKPYFGAHVNIRKDIGNWQLRGGIQDIFNSLRERWSQETYGTHFEKCENLHYQGVYIRVAYTFNPAKSKYKGGQAGQSELNRL